VRQQVGSVGGPAPTRQQFRPRRRGTIRQSVTGPQSYISPEEVAEFSLRQISSELSLPRSTWQFSTSPRVVPRFPGSFYSFFRSLLNALDNIQKVAGITAQQADGTISCASDYSAVAIPRGPVCSTLWRRYKASIWNLKTSFSFSLPTKGCKTGVQQEQVAHFSNAVSQPSFDAGIFWYKTIRAATVPAARPRIMPGR